MTTSDSDTFAYVNDLREWTAWSPWEGSDPDLSRTYSGANKGVGSSFAWSGNRNAGRDFEKGLASLETVAEQATA